MVKTSKGSSLPFAKTLFGGYTGIDGTSFGLPLLLQNPFYIVIHLLACLLARVWPAP